MGTEKGAAYLAASGLKRSASEGRQGWSGKLDSIYLRQPSSINLGNKRAKISLSEASAGGISLTEAGNGLTGKLQLLHAWLRTGTGTLRDSNTVM